jgi:hypothetical protein
MVEQSKNATDGKLELKFYVPIRLGRGENNREVRGQRIGRIQREREAVRAAWIASRIPTLLGGELNVGRMMLPEFHPTITLTRVAPATGKQLDRDNLMASLKSVRDAVTHLLGLADDEDPRLTWAEPLQERGDWGLWVHLVAQLRGPELAAQAPPPKRKKKPDLTDALLAEAVRRKRAGAPWPAAVKGALSVPGARGTAALAKPAFIAPPRGSR